MEALAAARDRAARLAAMKDGMPAPPWEPIVDRASGAEIIVALASASGDAPHGTVVASAGSPEVQCWIAAARNAPVERTLVAALDLCAVALANTRGDCYCGVGIGDPNYRGVHSPKCEEMRRLRAVLGEVLAGW